MSEHRHEPPELAGLTYVKHLGSGGYADVYLYEQAYPRQKVAVKVLHAESLSTDAERQVQAEANQMAELSHHPHIVQVLSAATAPDGRHYIVMRYYPGPNFGLRAAAERFSVAETLQVGIELASAIETAHRAGIFHRDIKPANILTDEYGHPALTDFGIAARAEQTTQDAGAMSLPWAPPEIVFGSSAGDARSDVYSLAATLWHLLVGHSPFEELGGDNRPAVVISRIRSVAPPATGRGDVPASLERALQNAMAKVPSTRPATALEFGRALQAVEQEQRLPQTRLSLIDTQRESRPSTKQPADATRAKPVQRVSSSPPRSAEETERRPQSVASSGLIASVPDAAPSSAAPPGARPAVQERDATRGRPSRVALPETDIKPQRVQSEDAPPTDEPARGHARKRLIAAGVALLVLVGGGIALASSLGGTGKPQPAARSTVGDAGPQDVVVVGVPGTPQVRASRSQRRVVFRWNGYDDALSSDTYRWRKTLNGKMTTGATAISSLSTVARGRGTLCLTVQVLRADGSEPSAFSSPTCVRTAAR